MDIQDQRIFARSIELRRLLNKSLNHLPVETAIGSAQFTAEDVADKTDACPWDPTNWGVKNNAAGQAWYDSLLRQYAGWGVDLLKVDCISDHPYKEEEIRMIRRAIDKTGRHIVLSLSPGPTALAHADAMNELAEMWRVSDDIWDIWDRPLTGFPQSVKSQFARAKSWADLGSKPGHWPDLDMLPLGELRPSPGWAQPRTSRLNPDEQQTLLTLWAMARSPLILGANLTLLSPQTERLLTNREVLRIDQTATSSAEILRDGELIVWSAKLETSHAPAHAVALFNLGDAPLAVDRSLQDLGLGTKSIAVTDVWTGKKLSKAKRLQLTIPPHGCVLLEP